MLFLKRVDLFLKNIPSEADKIGMLLVIQGVGFYFRTALKSVTALIPAFVGIPILSLGIDTFKESTWKHAMHTSKA
jgi:hypothetical protein